MIVIFPSSLLAADAGPAILHSKAPVRVNGTEATDGTAIMPGDLLETDAGVAVNLTTDGSMIVIQEQSVVKYNGDSLTLEHGSVSVGTSKLFSVHVDCLRVEPVVSEWTQYDVTDTSSQVEVAAHKLDVNIVHGASLRKTSPDQPAAGSATVHEGEQAKRNVTDACGAALPPSSPGSPVNMKLIEIGAGAGGGVILLCLLLCGGKKSPSVSQTTP